MGGGGGRARHGSPASLPQAPVVHPVSENSRTASVATTLPPPPDGGHDGCVPHLPRPRFLAPALPHSPLPPQPAEQHKPTCEPDRHHKCAAPANCAFGGGVPPARARAGHCVKGGRRRAVSGGSRRERSGGCAQRTSASNAGRPRANLCVRAGRHREPEGQARRAAWRRGGGGWWGQRWRGRGGCGRLRCTRATASAARGGATGASFWRVAVRAQPRVLRSSDGGAAAAPRTLPNGGGPKASAAPRPVFLTDERGGGLLSGEPDGDDSRAPSVCVAGFGSATNCGAGVLLPRANESQGCP